MATVKKLRIQLRRDTAFNWNHYNPVLLSGEVAVSSDINQFKIGDGTSKWSDLPYFEATLQGMIDAEAGAYPVKQANGTIKWVMPVENDDLQSIVSQHSRDIQDIKDTLVAGVPAATADKLGLVMGSDEENKISVLEDGTMEVNSLNITKLVQHEDTELIFNANY